MQNLRMSSSLIFKAASTNLKLVPVLYMRKTIALAEVVMCAWLGQLETKPILRLCFLLLRPVVSSKRLF